MSEIGNTIALLGLVADHARSIKPGYEFDKYFPPADNSYTYITRNGSVNDTVKNMEKIVLSTLEDTAKIAPLLKGKTLGETCQNIWNFIYTHIQYAPDKDGVEELRRPRNLWANRHAGSDCDCMTIFAASCLVNCGVPVVKFRVAAYDGGWQHVYDVVPVPSDSNKFYVIDCVLNQFNEEKPYSKKFDHTMKANTLDGIPIAMLGQLSDATADLGDALNAILNGVHIPDPNELPFAQLESEDLSGTEATNMSAEMLKGIYEHIVATRDYIRKNPDGLKIVGGATNHLKMLDYAILKWNTQERDAAINLLAEQEEKWNRQSGGLEGIYDSDDEEGLLGELDEETLELLGDLGKGGLKKAGKKFFGNVKKAVTAVHTIEKKIVTKIVGPKIAAKIENGVTKLKEQAKEVGKKVLDAGKKAFAIVKKFVVMSNPLSLMARGGMRMAMHVNLFGWARSLYPALISESEALSHGISADARQRSIAGLEKVANIFSKLGGKRSKIEKSILNGRAKKRYSGTLKGIDGLGEPYTTAVTIVAAATSLLTAASKMKQSGVKHNDYAPKAPAPKPNKPSVRGIGEAETVAPLTDTGIDEAIPEQEQFDADASGNIDESKKGLAKFIAAIRKFFSRNKQAELPASDAQNIVADEQTEGSADDAKAAAIQDAIIKSEEVKDAAIAAGKTEAEAEQEANNSIQASGFSLDDVKQAKASGGMFAKLERFYKANPKTTILVGALGIGALAMCFEAPRKAVLGVFKSKKSTNRPFAGLNGTKRKKSKKKASKSRSKHAKRVTF